MRRDFRVELDLSRVYQDSRRKSFVFVEGAKILYVRQLADHIQRLFDVTRPFHLLARSKDKYFFLPFEEDVRVLKNDDTVQLIPGTGMENNNEFDGTPKSAKHQLIEDIHSEATINQDSEKSVSNNSMATDDNNATALMSADENTFYVTAHPAASTTDQNRKRKANKAADKFVENEVSFVKTLSKKPKIIDSVITTGKRIRFQNVSTFHSISISIENTPQNSSFFVSNGSSIKDCPQPDVIQNNDDASIKVLRISGDCDQKILSHQQCEEINSGEKNYIDSEKSLYNTCVATANNNNTSDFNSVNNTLYVTAYPETIVHATEQSTVFENSTADSNSQLLGDGTEPGTADAVIISIRNSKTKANKAADILSNVSSIIDCTQSNAIENNDNVSFKVLNTSEKYDPQFSNNQQFESTKSNEKKDEASEKSLYNTCVAIDNNSTTDFKSMNNTLYVTAYPETILHATEQSTVFEDSTADSNSQLLGDGTEPGTADAVIISIRNSKRKANKAADIFSKNEVSSVKSVKKTPKIIDSVITTGKRIRFQDDDSVLDSFNEKKNSILVAQRSDSNKNLNGAKFSALMKLRKSSTPMTFSHKKNKKNPSLEYKKELDFTSMENISTNSSLFVSNVSSIIDCTQSNAIEDNDDVSFKVLNTSEKYDPQFSNNQQFESTKSNEKKDEASEKSLYNTCMAIDNNSTTDFKSMNNTLYVTAYPETILHATEQSTVFEESTADSNSQLLGDGTEPGTSDAVSKKRRSRRRKQRKSAKSQLEVISKERELENSSLHSSNVSNIKDCTKPSVIQNNDTVSFEIFKSGDYNPQITSKI